MLWQVVLLNYDSTDAIVVLDHPVVISLFTVHLGIERTLQTVEDFFQEVIDIALVMVVAFLQIQERITSKHPSIFQSVAVASRARRRIAFRHSLSSD